MQRTCEILTLNGKPIGSARKLRLTDLFRRRVVVRKIPGKINRDSAKNTETAYCGGSQMKYKEVSSIRKIIPYLAQVVGSNNLRPESTKIDNIKQ